MKALKIISALLLFTISFIAITGCKKNANTSKVEIRITDSPANYDALNLDIQRVEYHLNQGNQNSGWSVLDDTPRMIDILKLTNGLDSLIASAEIPSGRISQIRLILGSNNTIVVNGTMRNITVPSGNQTGLKLNVQTNLEAELTYRFLLDFDVAKSVVVTGNNNYMLKPVIRVIVENNTGSITGTVSPVEAEPVIYVIKGTDTVSTFTNAQGKFLVKGLTIGSYSLKFIPKSNFSEKTITNQNVTVGNVTNVGVVTF